LNVLNLSDAVYRQRGAVLPTALIILVVLTILGLSSVSLSNNNTKIAQNHLRLQEVERVAQNASNYLISSYPDNKNEVFGSLFTGFDTHSTSISTSTECIQQWTGPVDSGLDTLPGTEQTSTTDHGIYYGKFYWLSGASWSKHPHLNPSSHLTVVGNLVIPQCNGGFSGSSGGLIRYTGTAAVCTEKGSWNSAVELEQVTIAELLAECTTCEPSIYFTDWETKVIATHSTSGATAAVTTGFRYKSTDNAGCLDSYSGTAPTDYTGPVIADLLMDSVDLRRTYRFQDVD
jgi:hypothetical protein